MNDLRTALGLLTIFPVRYAKISAGALAWYPAIGLFIGATLVTVHFLLQLALPNLVVAVIDVAMWAMITGGLHLDGFADACDALFAATTRERRLEILRDVHLGTFGVVGLILLLTLKVATVANATTLTPIFLAPILGRWAIVFAATFPLARREGMAATFIAGLSRRQVLLATMIAVLCCAIFGWLGLAAFVGAAMIAGLVGRMALNRLGGLTGDIYGMICESVEVGVLLIGCARVL
jgi:adenosylcobinamide-GDP ribazoletransferase